VPRRDTAWALWTRQGKPALKFPAGRARRGLRPSTSSISVRTASAPYLG
jgi:hypothetical protein